jgi:NAD(P)-dependent dehydrogenase (short-subunit alcohol dehydrogenase family)
MPNLRDRVVTVTGASRGAGRGIAVELGAAGATVYVTGRSTRAAPATGRA